MSLYSGTLCPFVLHFFSRSLPPLFQLIIHNLETRHVNSNKDRDTIGSAYEKGREYKKHQVFAERESNKGGAVNATEQRAALPPWRPRLRVHMNPLFVSSIA